MHWPSVRTEPVYPARVCRGERMAVRRGKGGRTADGEDDPNIWRVEYHAREAEEVHR